MNFAYFDNAARLLDAPVAIVIVAIVHVLRRCIAVCPTCAPIYKHTYLLNGIYVFVCQRWVAGLYSCACAYYSVGGS